MNPKDLITYNNQWLKESVFPLWTHKGIDKNNGGFIENLSFNGEPQDIPRRAMVQCRQIYSYTEAFKMKILSQEQVLPIVQTSTEFLLKNYSLSSGAFLHATHPDGSPESQQSELYTQAFILFGLARSYELLRDSEIKNRAKKLLNYLFDERRAPNGGFTEIKAGKILFQSNPHMHLFEAALAWLAIDKDQDWMDLTNELYHLCVNKFIDKETEVVCEYFDERWQPLREKNLFIFEPGHQFEWAWLLLQYEKISGTKTSLIARKLFERAEQYGVRATGEVVDELWSDFKIKKGSSRFWPQCERIKAALDIGLAFPDQASAAGQSADQALQVLKKFLDTPIKGLWYDTLFESGQFNDQAPKASSLYHIINAMSEYAQKRLSLP